jgi:signal transduction histidine kinase
MEKIVIGKTTEPPGREMVLPAGTHHVELHFDTFELASPEAIRMQYRLDDVDREWLDADSTATAVYSGIPVGTHQFHVRASYSYGVWDQVGIVFNVTQKPYFYETNLFRLAAIAGFALLLARAYQLRLRRITALMNARLDERLAERTRMARELHDTLLQSFHGLIFRFQAVDNMLPARAGEAKQTLESALEDAAQAITEARDAVQDMRSSTMTTNEMAKAIEVLGKELAEQQRVANRDTIAFSVEAHGKSQELHPILRDEIYRITGEALRNAFRHSRARRIEVEILYDARQFRVRVRDDGIGIDVSVLNEGRARHYGLPGMRERAKCIGGQLEVWTEHGAGTEVELTIPASVAYGSHASRSLRLFKSRVGEIHEQ